MSEGTNKNKSEMSATNPDQFSSRLKMAMKPHSTNRFAQMSGIKESTLRRYLSGSIPGLDKAMLISKAAGVSLQWLASGEGNVLSSYQNDKTIDTEHDEMAYIDRYDITAAAGHGSFNESEKVEKQYAFRRQWLEKKGIKECDVVIISAQGDSMEPTISSSDLLMVDTSKKQFISDNIYVTRLNDMLVVKRIQPTLKGFNLSSDNKEYDNIEVAYNEADDLQVIGKVVWIGKDV